MVCLNPLNAICQPSWHVLAKREDYFFIAMLRESKQSKREWGQFMIESNHRCSFEKGLNDVCPSPVGFWGGLQYVDSACAGGKGEGCQDRVPSNDLLIMSHTHLLSWSQCTDNQNKFLFIMSLFCKLQQRYHIFINKYSLSLSLSLTHTHTHTHTHTPPTTTTTYLLLLLQRKWMKIKEGTRLNRWQIRNKCSSWRGASRKGNNFRISSGGVRFDSLPSLLSMLYSVMAQEE